MRIIGLEEHCASPGFLAGAGRALVEQSGAAGLGDRMFGALSDVGEARISAMDAAGVSMQVLSLASPGTEQLDAPDARAAAAEANDFMAAAVARRPDRFAAFAALPLADPLAAADELERRVTGSGFVGAMINGHVQGRYLDDPQFDPVLERAERLGVPLYLHPAKSPQPIIDTWYGDFETPLITEILSAGVWGWHIETAAHVLRLMAAGVFDLHPRLQVIVGHLGESLTFMLARPQLDAMLTSDRIGLQRSFGAYLRENVHYTFSGWGMLPAFMNLYLEVSADRIMFSDDYPASSHIADARTFIDRLPISTADKERIAHGNAERLLRIA